MGTFIPFTFGIIDVSISTPPAWYWLYIYPILYFSVLLLFAILFCVFCIFLDVLSTSNMLFCLLYCFLTIPLCVCVIFKMLLVSLSQSSLPLNNNTLMHKQLRTLE